ncbi:hypothetical protein ACGFYY_28325 [Streptomyces sp. NPDC048331]|uniref:hypothetical protein n=1 Tax=Streptomyces sp. NPDC048331 TaxID=3365534 RepID=UPI0037188458
MVHSPSRVPIVVTAALLTAAALTAALVHGATARHETRDVHYATYADAVRAGEQTRGWLPAWVPQDATDLRLFYRVDSGFTAVGFTLAVDAIPPGCVRTTEPAAGPQHRLPQWWQTGRSDADWYSCLGMFLSVRDQVAQSWQEGA